MSVNLQKGQKINLRKENREELRRVMVGLGWDEVQQKRGLFGFGAPVQDIDCDASAILCVDGVLDDFDTDVVFYNNLCHESGAVEHQGDNLTGEGEGDDEQIFVDLDALPGYYDRIVFVVTIYDAIDRGQHFGLIQNAFIRICDAISGKEFCRFNLSENYSGKTAMIAGEIIKIDGEWKFNAIGQGTDDDGIVEISERFE